MNREIVDLGCILKLIPDYKFSMEEFSDRLRFQKMIYLLQAFGINLRYDFSWYLRGPYCSMLAANGFALQEIYHRIPDNVTEFENRESQKKFKRFLKFIKNLGTDPDSVEIAASIHCQKALGKDEGEIVGVVEKKQGRFTAERVREIMGKMAEGGII